MLTKNKVKASLSPSFIENPWLTATALPSHSPLAHGNGGGDVENPHLTLPSHFPPSQGGVENPIIVRREPSHSAPLLALLPLKRLLSKLQPSISFISRS
ncbi:hypothetical protein RIF29_19689 [Crotalaria pallida]|uniref:Uncharacterized protein n=1 Tax=Crotalaria pallida TaxID=3830 RepID=A0AAN9I7Y3_CROPI